MPLRCLLTRNRLSAAALGQVARVTHPAVDVEVGDLRWVGSDSIAAPVPRLQNWWFVKVWQTCEG